MIETAVAMCHAPIVVPAIAGARSADCERTTRAMQRTAERVMAPGPELVVLISSHAERHPTAFGISQDRDLFGDFTHFGHPDVQARVQGAPDWSSRIARAAEQAGVATWSLPASPLDHGSLVPLHFLVAAGFTGPLVVISLPYPGSEAQARFGRALGTLLAGRSPRCAVVASGDMSHRLQPGAPAGHHPRAREFDAAVVELIANGRYPELQRIDPALRELAAEDFIDSVLVATAAVDFDQRGHELLSYEGPFGVGYLEAILMSSIAWTKA